MTATQAKLKATLRIGRGALCQQLARAVMLGALTLGTSACATAVGVSDEEPDTGGRGRDVAVPDSDTAGGGADADETDTLPDTALPDETLPDVTLPDVTLPPPDSTDPVPDAPDADQVDTTVEDAATDPDAPDCPASRCVVAGTTCVSGALLVCTRDVGGCLVDRAEPCATGCIDGATSCNGADVGTGGDAADTGGTDVSDAGDTTTDTADTAETGTDAAADTAAETGTDVATDVGTDTAADTGADTAPDTGPGVAVCGNGTREEPEECDDGNLEVDDGCTSDCMTESPFTCANNGGYIGCNQTWSFDTRGSNTWGGYPCSSIGYNLHEVIFYFISPVDGPVTVATRDVNGGLTPDWDLLVLDGSAGTACGPAVTCVGQGISSGNNETVTFTAQRGRRYLLVVDGLGGIVTTSATGRISVSCE